MGPSVSSHHTEAKTVGCVIGGPGLRIPSLITMRLYSGKGYRWVPFHGDILRVDAEGSDSVCHTSNSAAAREKVKAGRKRQMSQPSSSTRVLRPKRKEAPQQYSDGRQNGSGRALRPVATKFWLSGGDRYVSNTAIIISYYYYFN